ncbi:MAG: mechanosensitive ion channel [Pseudomonadales bacterium]|nr:mechanosensitive ion channel [Pseudomonadales bacterium]
MSEATESISEGIHLVTDNVDKYYDQAIGLGIEYAPKFIMAIVTLFIGFWIINRVVMLMQKALFAQNVDEPLVYFLSKLLSAGLKALLLISVASMIGIETASFIAAFGAAGLAIGLALQGSLANFAGGVLILFFKPYRVGDLIEAQGHLGVVKEIQIFNTILTSPQNRRIVIPNGAMSNGSIENYSSEGLLRVDLTVGVAYDADLQKTKQVLEAILASDQRVVEDPGFTVAVSELGDSSVNLVVRPFVKVDDYWDVYFDVTEKMKLALDEAGISIPFPQRDVHLIKADA